MEETGNPQNVNVLPSPCEYENFRNPYLHQSKTFFAWREEGYWFCDKTSYLASWDELPDHVIFRRPPCFGKSTWIRILSTYYDVALNDDARIRYFGNLKIGFHRPKKTYLVLVIDFTDVTKISWNQNDVRRAIVDALDLFVHKYKDLVHFEYSGSKAVGFDLIAAYHSVVNDVQKAGYEIFLMIDEVDSGAVSALSWFLTKEGNPQQNFLGGLKDQLLCSKTIARGFAVGITTLTVKDSFDVLSSWKDLTNDERLEGLCGFDQSDLENLLKRLPDKGADRLEALRQYLQDTLYGYQFLPHFSTDIETKAKDRGLYNTSMVLSVVTKYLQSPTEFDDYDANRYLLPERLLRLFKTAKHETMKDLLFQLACTPNNLHYGPHSSCMPFDDIESVESLSDRNACMRLLLSVGFLTFQTPDLLKVPNKMLHHVICGFALEWRLEPRQLDALRTAVIQFFKGDPDPFVSFIKNFGPSLMPKNDSSLASHDLDLNKLLLPLFSWTEGYIVSVEEDNVKEGFVQVFLRRTKQGRNKMGYRDIIVVGKLNAMKIDEVLASATKPAEGPQVDLHTLKRESKEVTLTNHKRKKRQKIENFKQDNKEQEREKEKEKETGRQEMTLGEVHREEYLQALEYVRGNEKRIQLLSILLLWVTRFRVRFGLN